MKKKMLIKTEEEISPCRGCKFEKDDKSECLSGCKQIAAYQAGQSYVNIPHFIKSETAPSEAAQKVFPVKSPTPKPESWAKTLLKNQKQAEKLAKPAKIALPKVVAVPAVKQKIEGSEVDRLEAALEKSGGKCLICLDRTAIRRGLCIRCYCRWQGSEKNGKAKVLHPIFGKFKKMTLDELSAARNERYVDCLMPNCTGLGERRKLCSKCYKLWIRNKIEHPIEGRFEPKNKKSYKQQKEVVVTETEQRKIVIDLTGYDKLFDRLKQKADKGLVPMSHVILSLVSAELEKNNKKH